MTSILELSRKSTWTVRQESWRKGCAKLRVPVAPGQLSKEQWGTLPNSRKTFSTRLPLGSMEAHEEHSRGIPQKPHTTKTTQSFRGTVDHPTPQKTTVTFPDMSTILTPNHQFRFLTLPTSQDISKPTKSLSIPDTANFPFPFTSTTTTQNFIQFTLKKNLPPPNPQHLHYWGCHDLLDALDAYPNATIAYTDGSDDPTANTPSGAAITFNTTPPTTICNTSLVKGSYPAEIYAIILFTYLQHLDTLSQPIIFAIDNLSVCSTLHQIQQFKTKPFASNANCFALWYNYIWEFLHNTHLHIIFTWIKGHADFAGNEHSDKISKWISLNLHQHPEHHNPDTFHFIYHNHTPLPGRITRKTV